MHIAVYAVTRVRNPTTYMTGSRLASVSSIDTTCLMQVIWFSVSPLKCWEMFTKISKFDG